eukprot:TRINITY_DN29627_c0_g1_i3.p1 TRINITY_DN29627_c0_g1~~TRINITY_DN29627_c0_g1_i3.p1  ORF type:complete len:382 (+),score=59.16 TRINITY_DN29627_c0_g1_i3:62-1147(+)
MEPSRGGCDGDAVAAALESAAAVLPCLGPLAGELVQLRAQLGELRAEVAQLRGEAGSAAHDLHDWRAEELERLEQAATREKEAALRATEEMRLLLRSRDGDSAEGAAQAAPAAARDGEVGVRYFYKGQAPGRGKVIFCACPTGGLPATLVRARLCSAGLDLDRLAPYYYSERWQGYVALPTEEETIPLTSADPPLLDVQLEELPGLTERAMRSLRVDAPDGFFGIGIVRGKTESNHGLLWRTAYQLGASFTFSIGARYKQRGDGGSDTYRSAISCPPWVRPSGISATSEILPESPPMGPLSLRSKPEAPPLTHSSTPTVVSTFSGARTTGCPVLFYRRATRSSPFPACEGRATTSPSRVHW